MIASAMDKVGNEGVITVEEAKSLETSWKSWKACSSTAATCRPYFVTDADKMEADLEDPTSCCSRRRSPRSRMLPVLEQRWSSPTAAAHHRRGRGRRGAGHPGGQQAARHPEDRRGQGPGLRRSPQGHAGGHRGPDRRPGRVRGLGIKLENVTLDMLGTAKKVNIDKDNTTIVDGAGEQERHRGPGPRSAARSRTPPPTTTGEAPGASRQAGRRRGRHQGRRRPPRWR